MITADELREHLNLPFDELTWGAENLHLQTLLDAAQTHIERTLGFKIAAAMEAGASGFEDGFPPALRQAVLMLAGHFYETREASTAETPREVPFGVAEIVSGFREWTF